MKKYATKKDETHQTHTSLRTGIGMAAQKLVTIVGATAVREG